MRLALVLIVAAASLLQAGEAVPARGRPRRQSAPSAAKGWEQECLAAHNKWRRLHNAPELSFDKKIAQFAQKRAQHIARSDGSEFKHPNDLVFGENLAWHSRPTTSCADLIKMWYDEVNLYDFRRGDFSHETGHFTQLVWKETRSVGCARAISSGPKGGVYLVCNYDPPGNFLGEAPSNVERARPLAVRPPPPPPPTPSTTLATRPPTTPSTTTTTTTTTTTKAPKRKKRPQKKKNKTTTTKSPALVTTPRAGSRIDPNALTPAVSTTAASTTTAAAAPASTKKPAGEQQKKKKKRKKKKKGKKKASTTTTSTTTTTTVRPAAP